MLVAPRVRRALAAALLSVLPLSLAACGDGRATTPLVVEVSLTSQYKNLHKAGAGDSIVYGWNDLEGDTEVNGEKVHVQLLGSVEYTNGGGPFGATTTFSFADGSTLAVASVDGRATAKTDTSDATFSSLLRVIGGSGRYVGASGRGVMTGRRNDTLGGVVEMTFDLKLRSPTVIMD